MRKILFTGVAALSLLGLALPVRAQAAPRKPLLAWLVNGTSRTSYDFGTLASGAKSQTFTLRNSGGSASAALTVTLTASGAGFTKTADRCTGTSLGPRKSCTVAVRYPRTAAGRADAARLTATGKKTGATARITLTGSSGPTCTGPWTISPGQCTGTSDGFNSYSYTFTRTRSKTFTLTNHGTTTMGTGWFARTGPGFVPPAAAAAARWCGLGARAK